MASPASRAFFVCHEGRTILAQLPVGPAVQLAAIWREDLLAAAVNRGAILGIKRRGSNTLVPIESFARGVIPALVKDGEEYELVLDTSEVAVSQLLTMLAWKADEIGRRRPFNAHALEELQKRLLPLAAWDTCHVEGNTVPLSETMLLLERGIVAGGGHRLTEYTELVAARDAIKDVMFSESRRCLYSPSSVLGTLRALHTALKATGEADLGRFYDCVLY